MQSVVLVAGFPGAGKTTWIRKQLGNQSESAAYLGLGARQVPIDATYLSAEFPDLIVLTDEQLGEFLEYSDPNVNVYIELGYHLDLSSLVLPMQIDCCHHVAVLPPGYTHTEWGDWADEIVTGADYSWHCEKPQIWRSYLTGQLLEQSSLATFWYELTQGAYGKVDRAKGIFDLVDGLAYYFNFVTGFPTTNYSELQLPRWIEGRPDRFSGIDVVGEELDQAAIVQTLSDCCLEDAAIAHYQAQIRTALEGEAE